MYVQGNLALQTPAVAIVDSAPSFQDPSLEITPSGVMRACAGCRLAGLACASCPSALGQATVQTGGATGFLDTWAQKLRDIANILTNASRVPQYTQTGYEVTTSADSFKAWVQSPFTWAVGLTILLLVYKLRMAAK